MGAGLPLQRQQQQLQHAVSDRLAGQLEGAALALADCETDDEARAFCCASRAAGVPVNVIDKPAYCQFQFGSIVNRSPVIVSISTDGAAPILAQAIRQRIEADRVVISIHDNGTGMTEAQRAHLFVPFHTSKKEGLGLGLIICKRIIESYQGTIWAEQVAQGAVLAFSLPLHPQADQGAQP